MKETPNSWLVPTDPYDRNKIKRAKHRNNGGVSFNVFLCPLCNYAYEDVLFNGEEKKIMYYKDFPTYKLRRICCDKCDG